MLLGKRTLKRSAKENIDYKEKSGLSTKKRDNKAKSSQGARLSEIESGLES